MVAGVTDGVAQTVEFFLPDKMNVGHVGQPPQFAQQNFFVFLGQPGFEFKIAVEMVFNRTFAFSRNNENVFDARINGLLHHVLNRGRVDDGQHFFGLRLGGRQETGSETSGGNNGFFNHTRSSDIPVGEIRRVGLNNKRFDYAGIEFF